MGSGDFRVETTPLLADQRLQSLYAYWHALGVKAGGLPSIQAVDPLDLPKLLPNLWIMEVEQDTHRFRMRLAGENINLAYRRNIAGQYFSDVFEPSELDLMVARYTRTLSEPSIVCAIGAIYAAAGRFSQGERLALPMLGRGGHTDTMLGATFYDQRLADTGSLHALGNEPTFYPVHAANHRPLPHIAGA